MTGEAVLAPEYLQAKAVEGEHWEACSSLQVGRIINGKQSNIYILL